MSRQMKHFADYFMQGMQIGSGWAAKWQADQIAKERNRIMGERNTAVDKRENAKLGLYGEQVRANAELARAKAYRALNPVAKGGGGGGAPSSADADALRKEAAERGIISAPPAAAPPPQRVVVESGGDGSDGAAVPDAVAPVEGGYGDDGMAKGGMVRPRRYAEGGIVEGMSLREAQNYEPTSSPRKAKPAADPFSSGLAKGAASYKAPEEKKPADVRPTGPVGSGAGGSYTEADLGGVLNTSFRAGGAVRTPKTPDPNIVREPVDATQWDKEWTENDSGGRYQRGGTVRKFQSGGRVMEAIDTGTSGPGSGYGYRAAPPARRY